MSLFKAEFDESILKTKAAFDDFSASGRVSLPGHTLIIDLYTLVFKKGLQDRNIWSPELETLVNSIESNQELIAIIQSLYNLFSIDTQRNPNTPTEVLASPVSRKLNYLNEHYNRSSPTYMPFADIFKIFDPAQGGNPVLLLHGDSIQKIFPLLDLYAEHRNELYLINGGYTFDLDDHVRDIRKLVHDIYTGTLDATILQPTKPSQEVLDACLDVLRSIKVTLSTSNIIKISHDKVIGEAIKVIDLYSSPENTKKLAYVYKFLDKATINVMNTQPRHIYTIVDFLKVQIIETIKTHGFHNIYNVFNKDIEVELQSAEGVSSDPYTAGRNAMKAIMEPHVKYAEFDDKYRSLVDKNKMDLPSAPIDAVMALIQGKSINIPNDSSKEDSMFSQMVNLNKKIHQYTLPEGHEDYIDNTDPSVRQAAVRLKKLIGLPDTLEFDNSKNQNNQQLYNTEFKPIILLIFLSIFENTFEPIKTDSRPIYSQDSIRARKIHNYMLKIGIKPGEVTKILLTNRENPFQMPTKLAHMPPNSFVRVGEQIHGIIAHAMNVKGKRVYSSVYQYVIEQLTSPEHDKIENVNEHEIIMKFYNACVNIKNNLNREFTTHAKPIKVVAQPNSNIADLKYNNVWVLQNIWTTQTGFGPAYTELIKNMNKNKGDVFTSIRATNYAEKEEAVFNILMYNIPIGNTTNINMKPIDMQGKYLNATPLTIRVMNNTIDEYVNDSKITNVGFVVFPVSTTHIGPTPSLKEQGPFTVLKDDHGHTISSNITQLQVELDKMDHIDQQIFIRNLRLILGI